MPTALRSNVYHGGCNMPICVPINHSTQLRRVREHGGSERARFPTKAGCGLGGSIWIRCWPRQEERKRESIILQGRAKGTLFLVPSAQLEGKALLSHITHSAENTVNIPGFVPFQSRPYILHRHVPVTRIYHEVGANTV